MTTAPVSPKSALAANGVLSLLTGALLAVGPGLVGGWLDVSIDGWLRLLGIGLLGHAAALFWVTSTQHDLRGYTRMNLALIAPYPILMIAIVASDLVDRDLGRGLLLLDGAAVGALAALQWAGLRLRHNVAQPQNA